jgi:hypothetical protein
MLWVDPFRTPSILPKIAFAGSTVIADRLVQEANAEFPILVTLLGTVTLVRLVQAKNASPPMLVTLVGIVTLVRR